MDKRSKRKISEELIKQINEYYDAGNSSQKTADKFGVSKTTVLEYVKPRGTVRIDDETRKKRRVTSVQKRRYKLKELSVEYKGGKCETCGYHKCIKALEFHHLDPNEKDFAISKVGYSLGWEKVKLELDKCIMVCANCHREIHENMLNSNVRFDKIKMQPEVNSKLRQ